MTKNTSANNSGLANRNIKNQFNGFDSKEDYELVLDAVDTAIIAGLPDGFVHTIQVGQEDGYIIIFINDDCYEIETMKQYRKWAEDLLSRVKLGTWKDWEDNAFGYGQVEDYDEETGKVTVGYDGSSWEVLATFDEFLKEFISEDVNDIVEEFAGDHYSQIMDYECTRPLEDLEVREANDIEGIVQKVKAELDEFGTNTVSLPNGVTCGFWYDEVEGNVDVDIKRSGYKHQELYNLAYGKEALSLVLRLAFYIAKTRPVFA